MFKNSFIKKKKIKTVPITSITILLLLFFSYFLGDSRWCEQCSNLNLFLLIPLLESWAISKTRNIGTGNGMRGMRGTYGMFTRIPGNLLEDYGEFYYFNIPGNVQEHSGENILGNFSKDSWGSRGFWGMLKTIPRNVQEDSGECSRRPRVI